MESAQAKGVKINYVIYTKVVKIKEEFETIHVSGFGPNVVQRQESKGWFVYLQGSYEALFLGHEKPAFAHGNTVRITFEKVEDANPR